MKPQKKLLETSFGKIAYLEAGTDELPPALFVHGIPTSGYLWREVLTFLAGTVHGYAPDLLGLGDTEVASKVPHLHMEAQAEMLLEFMTKLGHETFALICHDQGGAAAQIMAARAQDRIDRFVITDCVAYDNWPVPVIRRLQRLQRIPVIPDLLGRMGFFEWVETRTPFSAFRRGVYDASRLDRRAIVEFLRPVRGNRRRRKGFRRFLLAGDSRYTMAAVPGLKQFLKPTLVIWAADDRYLSPSYGVKLKEEIPGAEAFHLVPFCGHFWQEEKPAEFASLMKPFLAGEQAEVQP